jgi:hypothetical protein
MRSIAIAALVAAVSEVAVVSDPDELILEEDWDAFRADELNDFHGLELVDDDRQIRDAGHVW